MVRLPTASCWIFFPFEFPGFVHCISVLSWGGTLRLLTWTWSSFLPRTLPLPCCSLHSSVTSSPGSTSESCESTVRWAPWCTATPVPFVVWRCLFWGFIDTASSLTLEPPFGDKFTGVLLMSCFFFKLDVSFSPSMKLLAFGRCCYGNHIHTLGFCATTMIILRGCSCLLFLSWCFNS